MVRSLVRLGSLGICGAFCFAALGCAAFQKQATIPVVTVDKSLPVLSKKSPELLIQKCIRYRPGGSYADEDCPAAFASLMGPVMHTRLDKPVHLREVLWVKPGSGSFVGPDGYFHAHDARIVQSHSRGLSFSATPDRKQLWAMDAFCREPSNIEDTAMVVRVLSGCARVQRGTYLPGRNNHGEELGPEIAPENLEGTCEHWGTATSERDELSGCEGDVFALKLNVMPLSELCHDYVRLLVVERIRHQIDVGGQHSDRLQETLSRYEDDPYGVHESPAEEPPAEDADTTELVRASP